MDNPFAASSEPTPSQGDAPPQKIPNHKTAPAEQPIETEEFSDTPSPSSFDPLALQGTAAAPTSPGIDPVLGKEKTVQSPVPPVDSPAEAHHEIRIDEPPQVTVQPKAVEETATADESAEPIREKGDKPGRNLLNHHQSPPALGIDEVSCRTCRFFESMGQSRGIATEGECRCKAPAPGADRVAQWPSVGWQSWCGEWTLGISDEEMVKMARVLADRMNGTARKSFESPENSEI